jgi:hypothetical protein
MKPTYQKIVVVVLSVALGFALANMVCTPPASAQQGGPLEGHSIQISAFGGNAAENARFGAYLVDTTTGKVWLIREGGEVTPVGRDPR